MAKWLCVFMIGLAVSLITVRTLYRCWTGDEPRYFYYSVSFFETGRFSMDDAAWWDALLKTGVRVPSDLWPSRKITGPIPAHAVFIPVLLSPINHFFSIQGGRIAMLLIGLAGIYFLFRLCLHYFPLPQTTAAVALGSLAFPALPYFGLCFQEIALFSAISASWCLLHTHRSRRNLWLAFLSICCIPFIHLRGAAAAACLFVILVVRGWGDLSSRKQKLLFLAIFSSAAMAVGALFVYLNLRIYNNVLGSVTTASPSITLERFNYSLFDFRLGLLVFAPIWIFSFIDLYTSARRREPLGIEAAVLLPAVLLPTLGPDPGVCWPARFWVAAVPILVVGFGFWLKSGPSRLEKAAAWVLGAVTLANTILFVLHPDRFLENHSVCVTYRLIFNSIYFHMDHVLQTKWLFIWAFLLVAGCRLFRRWTADARETNSTDAKSSGPTG